MPPVYFIICHFSNGFLGLAIVKQAADLHNASISVDSQLGVGTTVTVVIPVE